MRRFARTVPAAAALAIGLLAVSSGGAAEQVELLYTGNTGVHVLGHGIDRTVFGNGCARWGGYEPPQECAAFPKWSPDGTRVAIAYRGRLYVWDSRTGQTEEIRTHAGVGRYHISWSPDGRRIAFIGPSESYLAPQLYLQEVEGARRTLPVTADRWVEGPLSWSPDGAWIAYAGRAENRSHVELYLVRPDGSEDRRLTQATGYTSHTVDPVWSPGGDEIAFAGGDPNYGYDRLFVIRADGSGRREIANAPRHPRHLQWTADGKQLIVSAINVTDPLVGYEGSSIWSVNVDGSGSTRLTEGRGHFDVSPSLSPSGMRLAFARVARGWDQDDQEQLGIWVANADATCQQRVAELMPLPGVDWQPGTGPTERIECRDLLLSGGPNLSTPRNRRLKFSLVNKGGSPVTDVTLAVNAPGGALTLVEPARSCTGGSETMRCAVGTVESGRRVDFVVAVRPRVARRVVPAAKEDEPSRVTFEVTGRETELEKSNNLLTQQVLLSLCNSGDAGHGRIDGTPGNDSICGRRGRDRIRARAGDDRVQAGGGDDWIDAGAGRDYVLGAAGNDVVLARDRASDTIKCGAGRDRAIVDRKDSVSRDCERVWRR